MIVPVMAISNLVLTQQIYSEETSGAHAHYREPVPLSTGFQWPTPELFDKIWAAHPWSGTEKTSDPPPNQNQ